MTRGVLIAGLVLTLAGPVDAMHPSPPTGFEAALVGLLELPLVYSAVGGAEPKAATPARLDVLIEPSESARLAATIDRDGIATRDGVRCFWQREPQCRYHESGYEEPAVAVFERRSAGPAGAWYRIAIDRDGRRFGWIRSAGPYHALATLVMTPERLTYLTPAWRSALFDRPAAPPSRPAARSRDPRAERPMRALRSMVLAGQLWLEIELLDGVCEGEERVVDTGWVPVRDAAGTLLVWYWSRGC